MERLPTARYVHLMEASPKEALITPRAAAKVEDLKALRGTYMTGIRKRVGNVNKLGTILSSFGVIVIGGVGILRFADIFPFESERTVLLLMTIGFVLMVVTAAIAALTLNEATLGSVMKSDAGQMPGLSRAERKVVESVYSGVLISTDASNLRALEARGARLDRISDRLPHLALELRSQSAVIDAEVSYAFAQARLAILNRRAGRAIRVAGICTAFFLLGLGGVLVTIDRMESDRAVAAKEAESKEAALEASAESGSPIGDWIDKAEHILRPYLGIR